MGIRTTDVAIYDVKVTIPRCELNNSQSVLDRVTLATALFICLMEGSRKWWVVDVDFESEDPTFNAKVKDPRFRGLRSGRAIVEITPE